MKRTDQIIFLLKREFHLYLAIGFGIFLFILFFQPFQLDHFDFNNRLIFIAGLGTIVVLFIVIIRLLFHPFISPKQDEENPSALIPFLGSFLLLALTTTSFVFYLRYVGHVEVTFYLVIKSMWICLVPPIILKWYFQHKKFAKQIETFQQEIDTLRDHIKKYEGDYLKQTVEFVSEYKDENLYLTISTIVIIKSADNYVEIVYKEGETFVKKLIRNTLKNVEQLLKPYKIFIRCHRTYIVNSIFIDKLFHEGNGYWISLNELNEDIPVSRQYLLVVKQMIKHSRDELHSP